MLRVRQSCAGFPKLYAWHRFFLASHLAQNESPSVVHARRVLSSKIGLASAVIEASLQNSGRCLGPSCQEQHRLDEQEVQAAGAIDTHNMKT